MPLSFELFLLESRISNDFVLSREIISCWRSPSNIALIKYWGKKGFQKPANPSLSITLSRSYTQTKVSFTPQKSAQLSLEYYFHEKRNKEFENKVLEYLRTASSSLPFILKGHLKVESFNTFPHSAGIASSASSMSSLALCLLSIHCKLSEEPIGTRDFFRAASNLARLGSGSACRSVYGYFSVWGQCDILESSDDYAIPLKIDSKNIFNTFQDTILIVDDKPKEISSRAGHQLMMGHWFAQSRYQQASQHLKRLIEAIHKEDLEVFGKIVESEALTLHALMMTSARPYILMKNGTINIIQEVWKFREKSKIPVYFTLDAGPNVHLLYPYQHRKEVNEFIESKLIVYCARKTKIDDFAGSGPEKII